MSIAGRRSEEPTPTQLHGTEQRGAVFALQLIFDDEHGSCVVVTAHSSEYPRKLHIRLGPELRLLAEPPQPARQVFGNFGGLVKPVVYELVHQYVGGPTVGVIRQCPHSSEREVEPDVSTVRLDVHPRQRTLNLRVDCAQAAGTTAIE